MTERRKFLRFATEMRMEYMVSQRNEINGVTCIKDLSREGMRCLTPRQFEKGTMLDMKFLLPDDAKPVYLTGEVVWTDKSDEKDSGYMMGIKFSKIDTLDRVRLLDYAYREWLKSSKCR